VYTQCSKCETVFKLSAEVLRAASGQVRCGKCGEVFNALARLAEDSSAFATGESPLDLETRADRILESASVLKVAHAVAKDYEEYAPPGVEIAQLEVLDWNEDEDQDEEDPREHQETDVREVDGTAAGNAGAESPESPDELADRSMEFTLPPGELDRIFVESKRRSPPAPPQAEPQPEPPPESPDILIDVIDLEPHPESAPSYNPVPPPAPAHARAAPPTQAALPTAPPVSTRVSTPSHAAAPLQAAASTGIPAPKQPTVVPPAPSPLPEPLSPPELLPHPESVGAASPPAAQRVSGFEVPEDVRRDMLEGFEQHIAPANAIHNSRRRSTRSAFILWLTAAIVSALLLLAQIAHQNRAWMIAHAHGPFGGGIRALYGVLGTPLPLPANLSAYQLRQWGVTGDPDANGTLRVRASILNTAAQLQPYPLLRVNLADRFGKSIGRRDFEAAEYLGKPTARLLAPGERVDATLQILDPGKNAEGFEIDVCLRGADQRIACQSDASPQPKQ
jgi:predicted Zn finger-like uncharacterized protein